MYAKEVTINNPTGLNARPATQLVREAEKYQSEIRIIKENMVINPKSIFNVLAAGLSQGIAITVEAEGTDEREAVESLCRFIEDLKE